MITIVGGTYIEHCSIPSWDKIYGSGLRAVHALKNLSKEIKFQTYINKEENEYLELQAKSLLFKLEINERKKKIQFGYLHPLSNPQIVPSIYKYKEKPIEAKGKNILLFGMLECEFKIYGERVVYDPQSPSNPIKFFDTDSNASKLALIMNLEETKKIFGHNKFAEKIKNEFKKEKRYSVIIIKCGGRGAILYTKKKTYNIPIYKSNNIWSIGSGDIFSSVFAHYWAEKKLSPERAANFASLATAYYCNTTAVPIPINLKNSNEYERVFIDQFKKKRDKKVYLAGPFFNLQQLWMINEARSYLGKEGIEVFSPRHDIGFGNPDYIANKDLLNLKNSKLVFAILDGMDSGTLFEIGYAKALKKDVIIFAQNENKVDFTMLRGTGCEVYNDFTTAIYHVIWKIFRK